MNKGNRKKQHERYYKKNKVHDRNKYIKYTDLECKWILEHNTTDVEFARMIGKSLMAIQCKRVRLVKSNKVDKAKVSNKIKKDVKNYSVKNCPVKSYQVRGFVVNLLKYFN